MGTACILMCVPSTVPLREDVPEPGDAVTSRKAARILDRSMTTVARNGRCGLRKGQHCSTASSATATRSGSRHPAGRV